MNLMHFIFLIERFLSYWICLLHNYALKKDVLYKYINNSWMIIFYPYIKNNFILQFLIKL